MSNLTVATQQVALQQKKQPSKTQLQQKKQESVSFFDEKWSGQQIAKLTGDNAFTDWLQDKDKVCTDGKDDGKLGFWEGAKSLAKGLIGGIPKAIINHPVASAIAIGVGAVATAVAGAAILVPLTAAGVVAGVAMAGYGAYKADTAKTDGEAKKALETCGMGITTTALSTASAGKVLEAANKAGVNSAQVAEDASKLTKVWQLFKATPEALKVSGNNLKANYLYARTGIVSKGANIARKNVEIINAPNGKQTKFQILEQGTKFMTENGESTLAKGNVLVQDANGNLYQESVTNLLKNPNISEAQIDLLNKVDPVAVELHRNPNGFLSRIPKEFREEGLAEILKERKYYDVLQNSSNDKAQAALWRMELQGGREFNIKRHILKNHDVKMIYMNNDYNGPDPLVGYSINGQDYNVSGKTLPEIVDNMFQHLISGKTTTTKFDMNEWVNDPVYGGLYCI